MSGKKRIALYVRVSTSLQTTDSQLNDLRVYAQQRGLEIAQEYKDEGISGSRESRPALNALMTAARQRKFNGVLVWSFSRFSRTLRQLVLSLEEFQSLNIDFVSFSEAIDTGSPSGRVLFAVIAAFSQFEREIIRERVMAGLRNAKLRGRRLGRPARIDRLAIVGLRHQGLSLREIAKQVGATKGAVSKILSQSALNKPSYKSEIIETQEAKLGVK